MEEITDRGLRSVFQPKDKLAFYSPTILGPSTIAQSAASLETIKGVRGVLDRLEPDDYVTYLKDYLDEGVERFGSHWNLLEIMNVLYAASKLIEPRRYLEIGVRR